MRRESLRDKHADFFCQDLSRMAVKYSMMKKEREGDNG